MNHLVLIILAIIGSALALISVFDTTIALVQFFRLWAPVSALIGNLVLLLVTVYYLAIHFGYYRRFTIDIGATNPDNEPQRSLRLYFQAEILFTRRMLPFWDYVQRFAQYVEQVQHDINRTVIWGFCVPCHRDIIDAEHCPQCHSDDAVNYRCNNCGPIGHETPVGSLVIPTRPATPIVEVPRPIPPPRQRRRVSPTGPRPSPIRRSTPFPPARRSSPVDVTTLTTRGIIDLTGETDDETALNNNGQVPNEQTTSGIPPDYSEDPEDLYI